MIIVVEGIDNSGKSTLASYLSYALGMSIQESEGPPKYPGEMAQRLAQYAEFGHIIFDRHPVISQPIYGEMRQDTYAGETITDEQRNHFYDSGPIIIYCDPIARDLDGHKHHEGVDTPEHLLQIKKNYDRLLSLYRAWAVMRAHLLYRIGDSQTDIYRRIRQSSLFADITQFHKKFGLSYGSEPRHLPADLREFRINTMFEEVEEYTDAVGLEDQFDALIDLVYFALGTAYLHGFPFDEGWRRVHEANMRKVRATRAEDSKRNSTHDVVKPPGWSPPSLTDLIA